MATGPPARVDGRAAPRTVGLWRAGAEGDEVGLGLLGFGGAGGLAACAGGGNTVSPSSLNQAVGVSYGTVESVTPVKVSPTAEIAGGVMGGLLGLALTAGHSGGSMLLAGAGDTLAGGLLGNELQGGDTADQFTVERTNGSTIQVTTESATCRRRLRRDEQGRHTNLRRTAANFASPAARSPPTPASASKPRTTRKFATTPRRTCSARRARPR